MHPVKLMKYLGEPGTGMPIELLVTETSNGVPYRGWLVNSVGSPVGRLIDFKFDFLHFGVPPDLDFFKKSSCVEAALRRKERRIKSTDSRFKYSGEWHDVDGYMRVAYGNAVNAEVVISSVAHRVDIELHAHQWSGVAAVFLNGVEYEVIDLFTQGNPLTRIVRVDKPLDHHEMVVTIRRLDAKNELSNDSQLIVEGAIEYLDELERPKYLKVEERIRGGAQFSDEFNECLGRLPPDAVVLDVGGGKRQLNDERYINLEYSLYDEPDMFGDAQALPFRSDSIDLVYCTGVLEHVPDLLLAVREIYRVLKPGGRVLACVPFIQPLHNEPQHFFNATSFGVEFAFSAFSHKKITWGGEFFWVIKWLAESASLDKLADPQDWVDFLRLAEKISQLVSYEKLKYVSSHTWVDAVKGST